MAFVTNILTPILKGVLLFGFFAAFIIAIVWLILKYLLTKERRLWIKYHLFRKKYNEEWVSWCMDALKKDYTEEFEIRKLLLTKSIFPLNKIEEIIFIFKEVRELKGGYDKKNGRIRQSRREAEFPKVEEKTSKS